jgi:hypothetical protein
LPSRCGIEITNGADMISPVTPLAFYMGGGVREEKSTPARPRESGDPAQRDWISAYAGMSGETC